MNHLAIAVTDDEIQSKTPVTAFDEKLRRALSDPQQHIVIYLHPVLGCGIDLLEWLENWQIKFQKQNKLFYIVPGNVNQLECLEVSHPDQALRYLANTDDLEALLDSLQPSAIPASVSQVPAPAAQIAEMPEPQPQHEIPIEASQVVLAPVIKEPEEESPPRPPVHLDVGMMVEVSAEYRCTGCQTSRMWLKGDITTECANPECPGPENGWEMTYELF